MGKRLTPVVALVGGVWLAACSTPVKSPVVERSTVLSRTPQASPSAASSAGAIPEFHRVAPGETLATIARRYGVSRETLIQLNGLSNPDRIFVGQNLRLRPSSAEEGSASGVQVFPVGSGSEPPGEAPPPVAAGGRLSAPPVGGGPASGSGAVAPPPPASATPPGAAAAPEAVLPAPPAVTEGSSAVASGSWVWPAKGAVLASFDGKNRKGIDIGGQQGDPVVAAADGTVSYVGEGIEGFGLIVILQHPGDFVSVYAHNQKVTVKEGETVRRGQTIAHLGRTGNTDRPKLHFQIRRAGKAIDPETLLPKR